MTGDPAAGFTGLGFIGLGAMGTPMTQALLRAGFAVTGYDTDPAARGRLAAAGGTAAQAAAGAAAAAGPLILMLPDSAAVESVAGGLAASGALRPGHLVIDMSSSEPQRTRDLAARLAARDVTLIDAPVSGGVPRARSATLTIMAGGDPADLDRARPVLAAMGEVTHAGPVGAGHAVKALNNLLSAAHLLATAEVMTAGERFGLDPRVMLDVFNSSSGRSGSTQLKWPEYVLTSRYDSGFSAALMAKDARIALGLIRAAGTPAAVAAATADEWSRAAAALPAADHTEIARWVSRPGQ
jgi:3-hydroxyisobutyrate dehydrogenase